MYCGSGPPDSDALATEFRKLRDRLGIPVKNEYRSVGYSTKRIESVLIARLLKAKRRKRRLHPRSGIAQQVQIIQPACRIQNI
jgi:hypothetical protein